MTPVAGYRQPVRVATGGDPSTQGVTVLVPRLFRSLPRGFRQRLIARLPPARQLWTARHLARIARRPAPARRAADGRLRVPHRGGEVWAEVSTTATPLAVRQHNLDAVVRVLDGAAVPYFCVPGDDLSSTVAVPLPYQQQVLDLLRHTPDLAGCYLRLTAGAGGARRRTDARPAPRAVAHVFRPVTDPAGNWVLGSRYACHIEFWRRSGELLTGPRRDARRGITATPVEDVELTAPAYVFSRLVPRHGDPPRYRTRGELAQVWATDVDFPIDAVYTWVDGSDPHWRERKMAALSEHGLAGLNAVAANDSRYANRDELRYSLRGVTCFAPWVRHIYLVTDDQVPPWLDVTHPMITVVPHRAIFGGVGALPTFNSHAIEARLHHIPGLAEHFLYFNDDMFLGRPLPPHTFFHPNGVAKFFLSPAPLAPGPATVDDPPVTAAGKNNRRHIAAAFGRTITQKLRHVPYPLRRSVLAEIEAALPGEVLATAAHQFRHPGDLSIPSSLQHYWSFLTGRAVPGTIRYRYADLSHPWTPFQLAELRTRRNVDVFCLNDTDSDEESMTQQSALLAEFLPAYFPFRAPFELTEEETRARSRLSATELARQPLASIGDSPATARGSGP